MVLMNNMVLNDRWNNDSWIKDNSHIEKMNNPHFQTEQEIDILNKKNWDVLI